MAIGVARVAGQSNTRYHIVSFKAQTLVHEKVGAAENHDGDIMSLTESAETIANAPISAFPVGRPASALLIVSF